MSDLPTKERLAQALEQRMGTKYDPRVEKIIKLARNGYYDDYESPLPMPIATLIRTLESIGYTDLVDRVKEGEFDGSETEGMAWMEKEGWKLLRGEE